MLLQYVRSRKDACYLLNHFSRQFTERLYNFPPMLINHRINTRLFQLTLYDSRTRYVKMRMARNSHIKQTSTQISPTFLSNSLSFLSNSSPILPHFSHTNTLKTSPIVCTLPHVTHLSFCFILHLNRKKRKRRTVIYTTL